ncbi:hypothetical protein AVEN_134730-1 [Araneus ventricosus]|uniref:Uncharacterized protein n=2 Tax=Araneus ventricosus TaxID=182803 RepID=A0A4Y2UR26_ARAVE|nr:hypothetical protein AVEN_134730-1 [Araneus ventricosus]
MDIENTLALIVISSWFWLTANYIIFGDLYDLIVDFFCATTLTVFGYLLVALNRAIRREKKDPIKTDENEKKMKVDAICQMEEQKLHEKSIEVEQEKSAKSAKVALNQCLEKTTELSEMKEDTSTQTEQIHFNTASTQTLSKIQHDKQIQAFLQVSENKETQTFPNLFSDKEVQTEAIPNATKVFVPIKRQKPKPTVPLTKEFQNYHRRKHDVQRRKIKCKPKLEVITEAQEYGDDLLLHKLPSPGEMETKAEIIDNTFATKIYGEMETKAEIFDNTSATKNFVGMETEIEIAENAVAATNYGEMETKAEIVDKTFSVESCGEMGTGVEILDNTVATENYGEIETEAAISEYTVAEESSYEMSWRQPEHSSKLPTAGEMEKEAEIIDNTAAAKNYDEMETKAEIFDYTFPAQNYGEMDTEAEIVDNNVSAENYREIETEAQIVDNTVAAKISGEMSSEQPGHSRNDDIHLKVKDEIKPGKKGKKSSFLKKRFKNLKKFFKK